MLLLTAAIGADVHHTRQVVDELVGVAGGAASIGEKARKGPEACEVARVAHVPQDPVSPAAPFAGADARAAGAEIGGDDPEVHVRDGIPVGLAVFVEVGRRHQRLDEPRHLRREGRLLLVHRLAVVDHEEHVHGVVDLAASRGVRASVDDGVRRGVGDLQARLGATATTEEERGDEEARKWAGPGHVIRT